MTIQVIVYSLATGRVRRVIDPQVNAPNVIKLQAQAGAVAGEATLVYAKQGQDAQGDSLDTAIAWQAAVNAHTGKNVVFPIDATATDWYCGIDGNNLIQEWGIADPSCGDTVVGLMLVNAPFGANGSWTYDGTAFMAPTASAPKTVQS